MTTPADDGDALLQQVHDRDLAQQLNRRLVGRQLPDVELENLHATRLPFNAQLAGWVVVEFFPGEGAANISSAENRTAPRTRDDHADSLHELANASAKTLSVVSDPPAVVDLSTAVIDPRGLLLCDPQLLIANALKLPTSEQNGVRRYRRLTLVTQDGQIAKVIFPPEQNFDDHVRRIVSWMKATRR
jgi:peroxiredoxin